MKKQIPKDRKFIQEYLYIEEYEPPKYDRKKTDKERAEKQERGVAVIDVF